MDIKMKSKKAVLEEIMNMMDERMGEELKVKSPKFMKVETNDPEMAEEVKEQLLPMVESEQKVDEDDESMQKLMEMYKKIKA